MKKNSKLESCRSRRGLQFSYKNHLHPMSYRRVMIFQRFNRNKLEKKKQNCSYWVTVTNPGRTVPCKTGLDLGWTGSQVRGARCPVSKFMDLFDTALQVYVPTVYFTHLSTKRVQYYDRHHACFNWERKFGLGMAELPFLRRFFWWHGQ